MVREVSLRLIYGRAGSGKSYFCLKEIETRLKEGVETPLILVVPEQFSMQAEKNLVHILSTGGSLKAEVLSFRRMAYRVFGEVGGCARRHISPSGKSMLLYRIIDNMKDDLKFLGKAAGQKGFVDTALQLIAEFKRYNVTPEALLQLANRLEDDQGESFQEQLKEKLKEIGAIYDDFETNLHKSYIDADDDLTLMAEKLKDSRQFDNAEIWIDEFSGFTPQEYLVIAELMKKAKRVNVCLCTDCLADEFSPYGTDVFTPSKNTAKKLIELARSNGIEIEPPVAMADSPYRFKDSMELSHLERYYFSYPYRRYQGKTQDVSLFMASNVYSEVEETAKDILALCRDRGWRYRDIAVVTGNLESYEKLIRVIFTEYGIPFFIDRKKDITSHPLAKLILSMLDIFVHNWSYETVFRYLKTGLTGIGREDIDILENYVLACGIRGSRWIQAEDWDYRPNAGFDEGGITEKELELLTRVNQVRRQVIGPLLKFRERTKGRTKAREICTALFDFLCEIHIPETMEELVEQFKTSGELALANEYSKVWNIIMEVLDQIVEAMGEDSMGVQKFREVISIGFSQHQMGLIPPTLDQVLVGSIDRSRNHEIKGLYILGVNDGVFPAPPKAEGVLSDRDRQTLYSMGIELAQDTRTRAFEEQLMVYTALTTAGNYLRISYPIADHEGRTLRPSIIISRMRKLFPGISESSNISIIAGENGDSEKEFGRIAAPLPTFNELVSVIRRQAEGFPPNPIWKHVYSWYMNQEGWREKCEKLGEWLSYSSQIESIPADKARKLYGSPLYSSISRLEQYASCPFSFYVRYGLAAKERKVYRLSPPDLGSFVHTVIDMFSKLIEESGVGWKNLDREWCREKVSQIVDELLSKKTGSILNSSDRYRYLTSRLKRVVTRAVWLIAEHIRRSGFEPIGYEVSFNESKAATFPPIVLSLPSGDEIRLVGRIDRVDAWKGEDGTYVRVIDYKSGSKDFKLSDVYYGLQIQLVTYLDALLENGKEVFGESALPGGVLYFKVDDPMVAVSAEAAEEEIEKAIMKKLKMKGLLLADVKLIKEMDREIDGYSLIIPAQITKNGKLGSRSSVATMKQFKILCNYVKKILTSIGDEMMKGKVAISPYKNGKETACRYCAYKAICQFDTAFPEHGYRYIHDMKNEDVWKAMEGGLEANE